MWPLEGFPEVSDSGRLVANPLSPSDCWVRNLSNGIVARQPANAQLYWDLGSLNRSTPCDLCQVLKCGGGFCPQGVPLPHGRAFRLQHVEVGGVCQSSVNLYDGATHFF